MIYGAMFGNIGFRIPMNFETGIPKEDESMTEVFTRGGKVVKYKGLQPLRPQNQTVSAILTLDLLPVGRIRFDAHIEQLGRDRGSKVESANTST
jgi:hypothetical protein